MDKLNSKNEASVSEKFALFKLKFSRIHVYLVYHLFKIRIINIK